MRGVEGGRAAMPGAARRLRSVPVGGEETVYGGRLEIAASGGEARRASRKSKIRTHIR